MSDWKLIEAEDIERVKDDSGLYVVISREETYPDGDYLMPRIRIRADLMQDRPSGNVPLVSFIGPANLVRKNLVAWIMGNRWPSISLEHASYIGYELIRAEKEVGFVQD